MTLGRLLLVGLGAGLVIGGVVVQSAFGWSGPYAGAFFPGAIVGMFLSIVVQGLNATVLQLARRFRPDLGLVAMRALLVPLPVIMTLTVELWLFSNAPSVLPFIVLGAVLSAVTAWVGAPWCLMPLQAQRKLPGQL